MGICYWCYWGWPKPIRDIYDEAVEELDGNEHALHFGPAHIVWEEENWDFAQGCLNRFGEYVEDLTKPERGIVYKSLVKLLAVPFVYKYEPEAYDGMNPQNFPPPKHWECERRPKE